MHPALLRGKEVPKEKLQPDLFNAPEGFIQLIYGRIRQGKSTEAVRRMVEALSDGISVYSNIALDLSSLSLDDRTNTSVIISRLFTPWRHRFYSFDTRNYHFMDPILGEVDGVQVYDPSKKGAEIEWLNTLTDCLIVYDEGQWLLDSYEATYASVAKRKLITETGHMNRVIVIVAQRTQSVHVNARGNVNQFFRCSKKSFFGLFSMLMVEEFQDMKGQDVDEAVQPIRVNRYFSHGRYWRLFNTHYLRRGRPRSQEVLYRAFDLTNWDKIVVAFWKIFDFALPALKRVEQNRLKSPEISVKEDPTYQVQPNENTIFTHQKVLTKEIQHPQFTEEESLEALAPIEFPSSAKRVKIPVSTKKSEGAVPIVPHRKARSPYDDDVPF